MKTTINFLVLLLVSIFCICSTLNADLNVIPHPQSVTEGKGFFNINETTSIVATPGAEMLAKYLAELIRPATGYKLSVRSNNIEVMPQNSIYLQLYRNKGRNNPEAYTLKVTPESILIIASDLQGIFYGIQTVRQLLPAEIESKQKIENFRWSVPSVEIKDFPRFQWRGMHLDVCRHMFPVEFIKQYIDVMAMYKLNTFHWHLTEDQGWRIEIKKYPKLAEIASKRDSTPIPADRSKSDGKPYGGYYTQEQVKEIVAYAADRFITVVPEIEMPGHSVAALTAYPELGCTGGPYKVRTTWGVEEDVYCAGNEQTFEFLENVMNEVLELFPSRVIHIGGDECPKTRWHECPKCQKRMKDNNLPDEHALQSYFITRMEKYLNSKGRVIIGWDEILEGGLAPNAMVMSWRGTEGGLAAARQNHYVVMSPNSHCYFDHYQSKDQSKEPPAIGGFLPLDKVYSYNPVPDELTAKQRKYIKGVQANLWTEYIPTVEQAQYMAYPRELALAEVAWTAENLKSYQRFLNTLKTELKRLDLLKVNYRNPFEN